MLKNQFVQMLVDVQKSGHNVYLTEEGYKEFLKLLQEDAEKFEEEMKNVG